MSCASDWYAISDDQQLSVDDQLRIEVSYGCVPMSRITKGDINTFLGRQQAIKSVLSVEDWLCAIVDPFTCCYKITVNPQPSVTAGEVRSAVYTALNQANDTHTVKADEILVGTIERLVKQSTLECAVKPGPSTAVTFASLAIIALVVLFLFMKLD